MMFDPSNDILHQPSSPTTSSISSSDLDTESTGSFFHDRSTTLGTLMGVTFPAITFRAPSQSRDTHVTSAATTVTAGAANRHNRNKKKKQQNRRNPLELQRRRRWWRLCSEGETRPASLGEFLEVERRFGDEALFGHGGGGGGATAELEGVMVAQQQQRNGRRELFADGRVLPPRVDDDDDGTSSTAGILCRFPVSLTGICSGGGVG